MTQHQTTFGPFEIAFEAATISGCDYIGRTVSGICAVVRKNGTEVFRSKPSAKRILPRQQALKFIEKAAGL